MLEALRMGQRLGWDARFAHGMTNGTTQTLRFQPGFLGKTLVSSEIRKLGEAVILWGG